MGLKYEPASEPLLLRYPPAHSSPDPARRWRGGVFQNLATQITSQMDYTSNCNVFWQKHVSCQVRLDTLILQERVLIPKTSMQGNFLRERFDVTGNDHAVQ